MQKLEVLVCTIDEGINNIITNILPYIDSISYLISWQQTRFFPDTVLDSLKDRNDVKVITLPGKGLARNRNNALTHATGDILLISDDDVHYEKQQLLNIIHSFSSHPDADILTFQLNDEKGKYIKSYPKDSFLYPNVPRGFYFSSWEIALRRSETLPLFDEHFGLGAEYLSCGEEEIFIHEAYLKGASVRYVPLTIGYTVKDTTGTHFFESARVRRSKGAVLYILHGYWGAVLRCVKFALFSQGNKKISIFKDLYDGIRYIKNIT